MGERRRRITADQTSAFLADLAILPFEIDDQPRETSVLALARKYKLTAYDAAYLELAQRKNMPLATADRALAKATKAAGVQPWQPAPNRQ
jgi:predicted nucleic acid-binding protein